MTYQPSRPEVSVIVPAFNVAPYLAETLDSILAQTYRNFEVLLVNDGSTDDTRLIAERYQDRDSRVRVVSHPQKRGVSAARNTALENSRGVFYALLDGDDVAMPHRLQAQVDALRDNPEVGMVGSHVGVIDGNGRETGLIWRRPTSSKDAAIGLLFRNTFSAVVLLRRDAVPEGGYRLAIAEDYDFNVRVARHWSVFNLDEVLTRVRVRTTGLTHTRPEMMEKCVREVIQEQLAQLGLACSSRECEVHRHIGERHLPPSLTLLDEVDVWLRRLEAANNTSARYDVGAFRSVLAREWFQVCLAATELGMVVLLRYRVSKYGRDLRLSIAEWTRFGVKCSIRHRRIDSGRLKISSAKLSEEH